MHLKIVALFLALVLPVFPAYKYKKYPPGAPAAPPLDTALPHAPGAEYLTAADKLFLSGVADYRAGRHDKALPDFTRLLKRYGLSPRAEAAALLAAQCHLRLENYEEAGWLLRYFPRRYPDSPDMLRCTYLMAVLASLTGDDFGSAQRFLMVYKADRHPVLTRKAFDALTLLLQYRMGPDQRAEVASRLAPGDTLRGYALFHAAQAYLKVGAIDPALDALRAFTDEFDHHPLLQQVKPLLTTTQAEAKNAVRVGVLLPRTAENEFLNEVGRALLQGVETAAAEHNQGSGAKVMLLVRDTRGNAVEAYRATRDLIEKEKVAVILGPLQSDELCAAAALAAEKGVPVISPTASALGIEALGRHVFLLTPPKSALMRALVDYAVDSLRIREFAAVFPNDEYGNVMAGAFRDAVADRGSLLYGFEMYERGAKNFKDVLLRLHDRKVEQLFEEQALTRGELLGQSDERRIEVDSLFMADSAVNIGALFMPGYPEEIIMLGPQVPFYKIHTQMLGASGWFDPQVLKHAGRYIEGAVVATDFDQSAAPGVFSSFQERFKARYHVPPDAKAALGYDALRFVLTALSKGRGEPLEQLIRYREYAGALGRYRFGEPGNANRTVALLKVMDEEFRPLFPAAGR